MNINRRYPRASVLERCEVNYKAGGLVVRNGWIWSASCEGIGLLIQEADSSLDSGANVRAAFPIENEQVELMARLVWCGGARNQRTRAGAVLSLELATPQAQAAYARWLVGRIREQRAHALWLGGRLVLEQRLTRDSVQEALAKQAVSGGRLEPILMEMGVVASGERWWSGPPDGPSTSGVVLPDRVTKWERRFTPEVTARRRL